MASPSQSLSLVNLDRVLRNMVKQNAALLELLAYGQSVSPREDDFKREHKGFVTNVKKVLSGTQFFLVSAIESNDSDAELPVLATFCNSDLINQDVEFPPPSDGLFEWLLSQCEHSRARKKGELGFRIDQWLNDNNQIKNEIHVIPYLVTKEFGETLPKSVQETLAEIKASEELANKFIYTSPVSWGEDLPRVPDCYFSAYACLGVTTQWKKRFVGDEDNRTQGAHKGDFKALLETLMMFYQMSWSNIEMVNASGEKEQKERDRQAALTYGMIREPVEKLVEHLQAAQQPLNRLEAILSPVRGLFASNIVGDKFFMDGRQTFRISTGPCSIEIRHHYAKFAEMKASDPEKWIELAAEQIAAVLLEGLGELKNARQPLWEYLRYALRFNDSYRQVAQILLRTYRDVFERGSSNLMECQKRVGQLFDLSKYWFHRAGRVEVPMRTDYLAAGLSFIFPEDSGLELERDDIDDTAEFWVSSELPVHTLSGLEALCRDYGQLSSATLQFTRSEPNQVVTLDLRFSGRSAKAVTETDLEAILESCREFKARKSASRGNMVYAIMQIFGDIPDVESNLGFYRQVRQCRASMRFGSGKGETESIVIQWIAPSPKPSD